MNFKIKFHGYAEEVTGTLIKAPFGSFAVVKMTKYSYMHGVCVHVNPYWQVYEVTTGLSVGKHSKTKRDAIASALEMLEQKGKEATLKAIAARPKLS